MKMRAVAIFVAGGVSLASVFAHAQGAEIHGRVTEAGDTIGVGGAEIELVGTALHHSADKNGEFLFSAVPAGTYTIRVRRLGYQPLTEQVTLDDGAVYDRKLALSRFANALTRVRIEGRMVKVPARFEEVYRRGARGWGTFITREDIDRRNPLDTKAMLDMIPGVLVNDRGITFQRCRPPGPAKVQVYVDGVRMTNDFPGSDMMHTLADVNPTSIQAMEVYRGVAQLPAEFLDDACAVIAIWTKAY